MKRSYAIAGSMLIAIFLETAPVVALAASPSSASSAASSLSGPSLYARMKAIAEKETLGDVDPDLARFVKALVNDKFNVSLTEDDISIGARASEAFLGRCGRNASQVLRCEEIQGAIEKVVSREERVRKLGRDLYLATSSYEIPLSEHMGKFAAVAPIMGSLLAIWQSGSDTASNTASFLHMSVAPLPEPQSTTQGKYNDLKEELDKLVEGTGTKEDLSELAAAIARYRFGYKSVRAEGSCGGSGSGGELGLLWNRWCNAEDKLNVLWQHLTTSLASRPRPIGRDELVLFPTWLYKDINVVVWVTNRDAGIDWEIPLEPVLPRMLDDRDYQQCLDTADENYCSAVYPPLPLPGGASLAPPEAPPLGAGVCNMPIGSRGFLCHTIEQSECRIFSNGPAPTGIRLSECRDPPMIEPVRKTIAGPDTCGIGGWRLKTESPAVPDDPSQQSFDIGKCSNCAVDFYCSGSCTGGKPAAEARQPNGMIHICVPSSVNGSTAVLPSYMLGELARAQMKCKNPETSLTGDMASCCATNYQAALVQCNALEEDGILQDVQITLNGKPLPVTVTICASTLANDGCGMCSDTPLSLTIFKQEMAAAADRSRSRLGLPGSCADAVNNLDSRGKVVVASLPDVCTPECRSEYDNSIGNNLCFIGQCIEQSWEEERLMPGRMSLNVGDEAFPWDSCVGTEPGANTDPPAASRLVLPTLSFPSLPEYNPWAAAQITDRALCQLLGLPPRTPPTLCMGEVSAQLSRPLSDPLDMLINLGKSLDAQIDPSRELERMAPGVGARYATNLYRSQIGPLRRSFAEIFDAAAVLLEEIGSTSFPQQMCSRVDRACPYLPSASTTP